MLPTLFLLFFLKSGNSYATCPSKIFLKILSNSVSCTLEFSYFFSLLQYTFTSHSSLLESSFRLWAPWEHLWLLCCPGGSRDSAVWSLRSTLGLSGNSTGPLNTPPPMPLNQSKPPLSFLLYSAFPFLYFFFFLNVAPSFSGSLVSDRPAVCRCGLLFQLFCVQINRWMQVSAAAF